MSTDNTALPPFGSIWNYGDPAGTRERFLALVPIAEELADYSYLLQLKTQLARTYSLQSNFMEAHALLDEVQSQLKPELELARLRLLLERGRCFNSNGERELALPLFQQAVDLGSHLNEWRLAIDAVHMVAIAQSDVNERIAWNLEGISLVEEHPEQEAWLWALYNNLGEDYLSAENYDAAHETFQKLLDFQMKRNGSVDMYTVKDDARALRLSGRAEDARVLMQRELDALLAKNSDDGWIRHELAEALDAMGRAAEAHPHFVQAYTLLKDDEYCVKFEGAKLERLKAMAAES